MTTSGDTAGGLADIYGELILDHNRKPRNFGPLPGANHTAEGHNPLCGDRVTIHLRVDRERIVDIAFEGAGCAISTASASIMTEELRGRSLAEARQLFARFRRLLTTAPEPQPAAAGGGPGAADEAGEAGLGKLAAFAGVREYPMRVKCATLAWHALIAALDAPADAAAVAPPA